MRGMLEAAGVVHGMEIFLAFFCPLNAFSQNILKRINKNFFLSKNISQFVFLSSNLVDAEESAGPAPFPTLF